jgi:hypothetical protein
MAAAGAVLSVGAVTVHAALGTSDCVVTAIPIATRRRGSGAETAKTKCLAQNYS